MFVSLPGRGLADRDRSEHSAEIASQVIASHSPPFCKSLKNQKRQDCHVEVNNYVGELFECLVVEEHQVLQKAELSMRLIQRTTSEAPQRLCTTSDLTFTRRRLATA
jgi:hypothetical protein